MTNKKYIKHLISESMAIKAENEKLKDEVELQEQTIDLLNQTVFSLRSTIDDQENEIYSLNDSLSTLGFHIEKLKEKYSQ